MPAHHCHGTCFGQFYGTFPAEKCDKNGSDLRPVWCHFSVENRCQFGSKIGSKFDQKLTTFWDRFWQLIASESGSALNPEPSRNVLPRPKGAFPPGILPSRATGSIPDTFLDLNNPRTWPKRATNFGQKGNHHLPRTRTQFWPKSGAKIDPGPGPFWCHFWAEKWSKNRSETGQKSNHFSAQIWTQFWPKSDPKLSRFWHHFGTTFWPKSGPQIGLKWATS